MQTAEIELHERNSMSELQQQKEHDFTRNSNRSSVVCPCDHVQPTKSTGMLESVSARKATKPLRFLWFVCPFHTWFESCSKVFGAQIVIEVLLISAWCCVVVFAIEMIEESAFKEKALEAAMMLSGSLSILLFFLVSFFNKECIDRWWEGRCLWGRQIYSSINLVQQASVWIKDKQLVERIVRHVILFSIACKAMLRYQPISEEEAGGLVNPTELKYIQNLQSWHPYYCLEVARACITKGTRESAEGNYYRVEMFRAMEAEVSSLAVCIGGCIRLNGSAVPERNTGFMVTFAIVYVVVLPFALVSSLSWGAVPVVLMMSWLIRGIIEAGIAIEKPFQDLDLDLFCHAIHQQCAHIFIARRGDTDDDDVDDLEHLALNP